MPTVEDLIKLHNRIKTARNPYEGDWNDIVSFVRPYGESPTTAKTPGDSRVDRIYEGTAPHAMEQLAGGLQSFAVNPVDRWFEFGFDRIVDTSDAEREEALDWFEYAADSVYAVYNNDASCFNQSVNEVFLDGVSFGTGGMSQEWDETIGKPFFRSTPLASTWYKENHRGVIDTAHVEVNMTREQAVARFGDKMIPTDWKVDDQRSYKVVQCVGPRKGGIYNGVASSKPFHSIWFIAQFKAILEESGYDSFPQHPMRWVKLAGEVYGRSPATKCLPDIRLLNQMELCMIKATQKIIDPPIMVDSDSTMLPLKSSPGAIWVIEPMSERPQPFLSGSNIPLTKEILDGKRDFIRQCFHSDWMQMEKAKLEMTATEVMDRREEKLRLLAPVLGRINSEFLGPCVKRTLELLLLKGGLAPPPAAVQKYGFRIEYLSAAAKAQVGVKATAMKRYAEELLPFASVDPEILLTLNMDEYARYMAEFRSVPRKVLRSKEEVQQIKDARQQAQQMQQTIETASTATQGLKNVAQAQAAGLQL